MTLYLIPNSGTESSNELENIFSNGAADSLCGSLVEFLFTNAKLEISMKKTILKS